MDGGSKNKGGVKPPSVSPPPLEGDEGNYGAQGTPQGGESNYSGGGQGGGGGYGSHGGGGGKNMKGKGNGNMNKGGYGMDGYGGPNR